MASVQAFVPSLDPITSVDPDYPKEAVGQCLRAHILLLVTIDSEGSVIEAEALTGPEMMRKAAVDAVKKWTYRPVIRDGVPVCAMTHTVVVFEPPLAPGESPVSHTAESDEELDGALRLLEISKLFPRSPGQVLADLEHDKGESSGSLRFYALDKFAVAALNADEVEKAAAYANELLDLAPQYPHDWNYGNAVHHGHMVLGHLALREGDLEQAKHHLLESGRTPGSPQLKLFGPEMSLAKELLERGERESVLEYLALCREFWEMGGEDLDEWTATVRDGGIPQFVCNLHY